MSHPPLPSNEDALDRALDALALGDRRPLDDLDAETRATLDQLAAWAALAGRDDAPAQTAPAIAPSPRSLTTPFTSFGRGTSVSVPCVLPQRSGVEGSPATAAQGAGQPSPENHPTPTHRGRPTPMNATIPAPTISAHGHRLMPVIWSAFAWLLIAALAGAAVYGAIPLLNDYKGPTDPTLSAYQPGTATPEAAEVGEVNYGGDAGRSWHLGDVAPASGELTILGQLGPAGISMVSQPLVVGDTIIATILDPSITEGSEFQTIRYDLTTGERMWTAQYPMFGPFATDGTFLYGLITFPGKAEEAYMPGAIWLDSGQHQSGFGPGVEEPSLGGGPVVADARGFFANLFGDVTAVNRGRLDFPYFELQQTAYYIAQDVADEDVPTFRGPLPEADLVISGDWLFVLRPSKTVAKYDRHTGEELDSFNLVDIMRAEIGDITLQATQGRLVVTARYADIRGDAAEQPANILFFETATLNLVARGELADLRSNLVVTPDWIYLAGRQKDDDAVQIYRMNPVGATFGSPFSEFVAPASAWFGLSLAGNTLMIVGPPDAVAQVDVKRQAVIQSGRIDLAEGDLLTVFPMQLWNGAPVAVSSNGTVVTFAGDDTP